MRLEIQSVQIKALVPDNRNYHEGGRLHIALDDLKSHLLKDGRLSSIDLKIIEKKNDNTRIVNLVDVIQPRCKLEGGPDFPGFVGKIEPVGKGTTRSLDDVAVVVANPATERYQLAFIDTGGTASRLSKYAKMDSLYVSGTRAEGVREHDFEDALKIAGMKAGIFLAKCAEGMEIADTEVFELDMTNHENPDNLPRICYYYQLYAPHYDHKGVPDRLFYGQTLIDMTPTIIHPNELLDGAVTGVNTVRGFDTYANQNHALVKELYRRHQNKEIIFCGVVGGGLSMSEVTRSFMVNYTGKLINDVLGADAAVLTKYHGGAAHIDSAMVAAECEKLGIKTALYITPLTFKGKLADNLLYKDEKLDLIIANCGICEPLDIQFKPETIIGGDEETVIKSAHSAVTGIQKAGNEKITIEQFYVAGFMDLFGGFNTMTVDY